MVSYSSEFYSKWIFYCFETNTRCFQFKVIMRILKAFYLPFYLADYKIILFYYIKTLQDSFIGKSKRTIRNLSSAFNFCLTNNAIEAKGIQKTLWYTVKSINGRALTHLYFQRVVEIDTDKEKEWSRGFCSGWELDEREAASKRENRLCWNARQRSKFRTGLMGRNKGKE